MIIEWSYIVVQFAIFPPTLNVEWKKIDAHNI